MHRPEKFWRTEPDAPFATLLRAVEAHCHPEAYDEAYEDLQSWARDADTEEMRVFKQELRAALRDPSQVPEGALSTAAQYGDGSDEKFLRRLWRDLYGDEPVDPEAG
ncbi:MAG: hypothetical protein GEV03_03465 [Streptosporangiales bacterium]|nr:hypothetical protein [Streptosporangiales bacterium]